MLIRTEKWTVKWHALVISGFERICCARCGGCFLLSAFYARSRARPVIRRPHRSGPNGHCHPGQPPWPSNTPPPGSFCFPSAFLAEPGYLQLDHTQGTQCPARSCVSTMETPMEEPL